MKLISWNVNGLRACIQKGFLEQFNTLNADFFCLQETKLQPDQLVLDLPGYEQYWCYAEKKGYSGTAIFTKHTPRAVTYGIGVPEMDNEGRVITLEYDEFYLVTCYTPNAQRGLARLDHRMNWDEAFRGYLSSLDAQKPVILCGDLNVAHQEIDLKNPKSNRGSAGFSDEERESFTKTLNMGFTDTFRYLNPDATGIYSWWSYMYHARENNAGWRIDYFLVSDRVKDAVYKAPIYMDIMGSDHCPVGLEIDLLCNGSVWSPSPMGEAKDITPVKEKKKISPAVKTVITTALLCVLLIGGFFTLKHFLPGSPIPQEPEASSPTQPLISGDLFTVTQLASPMQYYPSDPSPYGFYAPSPCLRGEDAVYFLDKYAEQDAQMLACDSANFWFLITLTEAGQQNDNGNAPPEIAVNMHLNGRAQIHYNLREYKESPNQTKESGWVVFGQILHAVPIDITLGNETQTHTIFPFENTMFTESFTICEYDSAPSPVLFADTLLSSSTSHGLLYDNQLYRLGNVIKSSDDFTDSDANFWLRISLTEAGMDALSHQFLPEISQQYVTGFYTGTAVRHKIQNYCSTHDPDQILGWIVTGYAPGTTFFNMKFGSDTMSFVIYGSPSPNRAETAVVHSYSYRPVSIYPNPEFNGEPSAIFYDNAYYYLGERLEEYTFASPDQENFWILITLTEAGKFQTDITPNITLLTPVLPGYANYMDLQIQEFYTDEAHTQLGGWFISGYAVGKSQLALHVGSAEMQLVVPMPEFVYGF